MPLIRLWRRLSKDPLRNPKGINRSIKIQTITMVAANPLRCIGEAVAVAHPFMAFPLRKKLEHIRLHHVPPNIMPAASGIAIVVHLLISAPGTRIGYPGFVPAVVLLSGMALWAAASSFNRLFRAHMVTEDLARSSRRLRMAMEIVQISVMNLGEFVNNLERISNTLYTGAHNQAKSVEQIASSADSLKASMSRITESTNRSCATTATPSGSPRSRWTPPWISSMRSPIKQIFSR